MRVAVVGAGIIGLACAEELLRAGHDVRVFDPSPAAGATHAAAGMLAPAGEAWHGEAPLLRLGLASLALWPSYAERLERLTGGDVGLRSEGTLLVGLDHDDLDRVHRTLAVLAAHDVAFEELDRRSLREREPTLARVAGGASLPADLSVNPRRVAVALQRLLADRLAPLRVEVAEQRFTTVDGLVEADAVIVATGAQARDWLPWVRPVRGETVRLRSVDPPRRVVRAHVHGRPVYVVPRAAGEVVVGATEEEHAAAPVAPVGAVVRLLDSARSLLPGLETAGVLEITARHRPGSPDNGPILGVHGEPGSVRTVLAVGHYRGGVLLAPLTAQVVRACVEGTPVPDVAVPFSPDRFSPAPTVGDRAPTSDRGRGPTEERSLQP